MPTLSLSMYLSIALVASIVLFGIYFKYSQYQLEQKTIEISQLQIQTSAQQNAIIKLKDEAILITEINNKLRAIEQANTATALKLAKTLSKLEQAALSKPTLVEKIINKASDERMRCIELVTGGTKFKKETNSVCPKVLERK